LSACLSVYQLCLLLCLSFYSICLWVLSFDFHLHPSLSLSIFPILSSALPLDRNMQQTVVHFHPSKSISTSTSTSSSYSFFFTNRVTHSMFDICVKSNSFFCGMFLLPIFEFINCMSFYINFTSSNQTASLYRMYLELSNTLVALSFILFYFLILTTFQSPPSHRTR